MINHIFFVYDLTDKFDNNRTHVIKSDELSIGVKRKGDISLQASGLNFLVFRSSQSSAEAVMDVRGEKRTDMTGKAVRFIKVETAMQKTDVNSPDVDLRAVFQCRKSTETELCCLGKSYLPIEGSACCGHLRFFPAEKQFKCIGGNLFIISKWSKYPRRDFRY